MKNSALRGIAVVRDAGDSAPNTREADARRAGADHIVNTDHQSLKETGRPRGKVLVDLA